MAHYRNITVNGRKYRWVVGKTHTYVRDLETKQQEAFANDEWGVPHASVGFSYADDDNELRARAEKPTLHGYVITPAMVRGMILGEPAWKNRICDRHQMPVSGVQFSPFASEIHDKGVLMENCPHCVQDSAFDI